MLKNFAQNAFRNFPKFSPIMLFSVPIMLALCSWVTNTSYKYLVTFLPVNALLEYFTTSDCSIREYLFSFLKRN